jgi:hypothetical protein
MKMKRKSILMILICSIAFVSGCGDETPSTLNTIKLDGGSFKVLFPSLLGVSIDGEGHISVSLSNITNSGISKTLSIDFEYSPNEPISGSYSFPVEGTDRLLDDFLTNYTEMDISGGSDYSTELESGRITVTENGGDNYTITMDLTMLDGKVFKGTYRGDFQVAFNNS